MNVDYYATFIVLNTRNVINYIKNFALYVPLSSQIKIPDFLYALDEIKESCSGV